MECAQEQLRSSQYLDLLYVSTRQENLVIVVFMYWVIPVLRDILPKIPTEGKTYN